MKYYLEKFLYKKLSPMIGKIADKLFLTNIDVAFFNLERQQAMGNIINLLGNGKKVIINPKSPVWKFFNDLGLKVYSWSNFNLSRLDDNDAKKNMNIISSNFSKKALIEQYAEIYTGK